MRLNVRRGLFRLWVVLSSVWAILVIAISIGPVRDEFAKALSMRGLHAASWVPDEPLDCSLARGTDYRREGSLCWYSLPTFRKLYPEYDDLPEKDLSEKLYAKAGIPLTPIRPWPMLLEKIVLAVGPPAGVLILGWAWYGHFPASLRNNLPCESPLYSSLPGFKSRRSRLSPS